LKSKEYKYGKAVEEYKYKMRYREEREEVLCGLAL
jgi:hypothetical protein